MPNADAGCTATCTIVIGSWAAWNIRLPILGILSWNATRGEKRNIPELRILLTYDLAAYNRANAHITTRVGAGFSGREHMLKSPEPNAQAVRPCAILRGSAAPTVQAAGAVCATARAL